LRDIVRAKMISAEVEEQLNENDSNSDKEEKELEEEEEDGDDGEAIGDEDGMEETEALRNGDMPKEDSIEDSEDEID
jgi:hypothetical protein